MSNDDEPGLKARPQSTHFLRAPMHMLPTPIIAYDSLPIHMKSSVHLGYRILHSIRQQKRPSTPISEQLQHSDIACHCRPSAQLQAPAHIFRTLLTARSVYAVSRQDLEVMD